MIKTKRIFASLMLAAAAAAAPLAGADVKLPAIFSDNMVLQADQPVPVWGWADAGETVTVTLGDQKKTAAPGEGGKWMLKLDPIKSGENLTVTVAGKNTIDIKNVIVGQVWVASGQSNMEFTMSGAHNLAEEAPKANYPKIRQFLVQKATSVTPKQDVVGKWVECTPETVKGFTAVGYFFAKDIHKALGVPVGIVHTSWGGTPAESWTSIEALKAAPELAGYAKRYEEIAGNLPALEAKYEQDKKNLPAAQKQWDETVGKELREKMAEWQRAAAAAKAEGKQPPPQPRPSKQRPNLQPPVGPNVGSSLYNGMVAPIIPFAIKGAIWYQGESNAGQAKLYQTLFPTMIKDWRERWGQGDFPFFWVQLASFMDPMPEPTQKEDGWPGLREAQSLTLKLPNTGQAVIIDVGEAKDIHPKNKEAVGQRLALAAEKVAYGKDVVFSGPTYLGMTVEGNKARLKFANAGGGLVIGTAPAIRLGEAPKPALDHLVGFSVAGEDRKFVWAEAKIEGDTVVVWSDQVASPKAVRYAWANFPEGANLYNKEGLPASPFRTDDWVSAAPQGAAGRK